MEKINPPEINLEGLQRKIFRQYYQLRRNLNAPDLSLKQRFGVAHEMVTKAKEQDMYMYRRIIPNQIPTPHPHLQKENKQISKPINLASNDYLGFIRREEVIRVGQEAMQKYGVGSGSVPMLAGTYCLHKKLEERLAAFLGFEACLLFNSGYAANLGCLSSVLGKHDAVFLDTLVHSSIIDGCVTKEKYFFLHNDIDSLKRSLAKAGKQRNKIIVLEGIYSMDGDLSALPEIIEIAESENALVYLDDAHGVGVLGYQGRGTADHFGLTDKVDILTGSFGKALAGIGGFVCGSREFITYLELLSRPFLFSSSLPVPVVACILKEIDLLETGDKAIDRLWENTRALVGGLKDLGIDVGKTVTPVIPIILKDELQVINLCRFMEEAGIYLNPIVYPVVSKNKPRLRISVTAALTKAEIQYTLAVFEAALNTIGI